jgi:ATP-dependent DNA helicase RecG
MTNERLIKDLIKEGESEQLEFKTEIRKEVIAKNLCAFLNGNGGRVIIGVSDNGEITGINNATARKEELDIYLIDSILPDVPITSSVEVVNKKELLIFKVWGGSKQPYIFDGSIFYRKGSSTQKATSQEISKLIHDRQLSEQHWERQVALGIDEEDLDKKTLNKTILESHKSNRGKFKSDDILSFLTHYGLYVNGGFTNACGLLFAKDANRFFPQARIRITDYPNSKTSDKLNKDEYLEGNLFSLLDQLEEFVQGFGNRSIFIENDWQRIDYSYPSFALREGFINALIHRDYSSFNSHFTISIYPDKLIIANSGSLPSEIGNVKELKKEHRSFPNNPDIAHLFFLRGYIEKLGRGTNKIDEQCKEAGLIPPIWKNSNSEVILTFFGPKKAKEKNDARKQIIDALNIQQNDALNDALNDTLGESVNSKVLTRHLAILKLLYTHGKLSSKDLTYLLSVSRATLQRDLLMLNSHSILKREGSDKFREYSINDALKTVIDALKA